MNPAITLNRVSKTYRDNVKPLAVLHDINLEVMPGEFLVLLGPSGCGKSTLLRIMSGLEKDFDGHRAYGDGIGEREVSFVFQQFALFPWMTVAENVALGLVAANVPEQVRTRRVTRELERFGLTHFAHAYPRELSGGMRQRVGIARALAIDPKVIFLDEPFSELDSFTAEELRLDLLKIWQEQKVTIVMVTHLIDEAIELADRIAVMTSRPGKIEKMINNSLPRPRHRRSPEFFKMEDELREILKP